MSLLGLADKIIFVAYSVDCGTMKIGFQAGGVYMIFIDENVFSF